MFWLVLQGTAVFIAAMFIDIFYALWFRFSNRGWEHRAAAMSVLCGAAGLLGAWMVISERGSEWFAIPDLAGLYLGTIAGLRFSKWLEKRWDKGEPKVLMPGEVVELRKLLAKYDETKDETKCVK